jgi:hypothetical protein
LVKLGVTVIVAAIGRLVVFVGVKLRLPVPLAGKPIAVLVFVQLYTVPVAFPLKATVEAAPAQKVWLATAFTVAVGFTVYVYVTGVPAQPNPPLLKTGVTVTVETTGALPVFTAVKLGTLPVPEAASPIEVTLFVQLKVVKLTGIV